jgi:hypothetical protein
LLNLAIAAWDQGDYPAMNSFCTESPAIHAKSASGTALRARLRNAWRRGLRPGDTVAGETYPKDSLKDFMELGERHGMTETLDSLAYACKADRPARAARIWGGVERAQAEMGYRQRLPDMRRYERQGPEARAALGDDDAFDRAWQEGRAMNLEQTVQYALSPR